MPHYKTSPYNKKQANTTVNHQKHSLKKGEMPPKNNSHAPAFFDFYTKLNFAFCSICLEKKSNNYMYEM
jgi:hypothetical protein